jgi:cobalt/nickel transport system permease protein
LPTLEESFRSLGELDALSARDSPVHRLDPRAKLIATLLFAGVTVSFPKYAVLPLLPLAIFPVAVAGVAGLPFRPLLRKLLIAAPFAVFVGIFNPLLDRDVVLTLGPVDVTGGMLSFASILLRFVLSVGAALVLIATTGMSAVVAGLERLGAPPAFAVQVLFLYRYLFVLADEAARMVRARDLRTFGRRGTGPRTFGRLAGTLLLRTLDRARRIHLAMLCRGFDGTVRLRRRLSFGARDAAFAAGWGALFLLVRWFDVPRALGTVVTEVLR